MHELRTDLARYRGRGCGGRQPGPLFAYREDAGIVTGYHARVAAKALGLPLLAVVRFSGTGPQLAELSRRVTRIPQVLRAYRMSGDPCFLAIVAATSTRQLEVLLDEISAYGRATTSIIVSAPVERWPLDRGIVAFPL